MSAKKLYDHAISTNQDLVDKIKELRTNKDVFRSPFKNKRTGNWQYYKRKGKRKFTKKR